MSYKQKKKKNKRKGPQQQTSRNPQKKKLLFTSLYGVPLGTVNHFGTATFSSLFLCCFLLFCFFSKMATVVVSEIPYVLSQKGSDFCPLQRVKTGCLNDR